MSSEFGRLERLIAIVTESASRKALKMCLTLRRRSATVLMLGVGVDVKSHLRRFSIYFLLKPSWPGLQEIANMNKKAKCSKQSVTM